MSFYYDGACTFYSGLILVKLPGLSLWSGTFGCHSFDHNYSLGQKFDPEYNDTLAGLPYPHPAPTWFNT